MGNTKQPTLPEATVIWANDLQWSWINTQLALKEAKRLGKGSIHYACTVVPIPPGDPRRNLPPEDVLRQMGHKDIIARLREVWGRVVAEAKGSKDWLGVEETICPRKNSMSVVKEGANVF